MGRGEEREVFVNKIKIEFFSFNVEQAEDIRNTRPTNLPSSHLASVEGGLPNFHDAVG